MHRSCSHCKEICKQLDTDEPAVRYFFAHVKPEQVIDILLRTLSNYQSNILRVKQCEKSHGNQLAVLMEAANCKPSANILDHCIYFICQTRKDSRDLTELWFLFGTPGGFCSQISTVSEFTSLIELLIQNLVAEEHSSGSQASF